MSQPESFPEELKQITQLDRTVHEPARLSILAFLYVVQHADFLYLERQTGMTRGNMASHLKKLEAAGYVAVEKKFVERIPRTLYHLTESGRRAFQDYREQIMALLSKVPE